MALLPDAGTAGAAQREEAGGPRPGTRTRRARALGPEHPLVLQMRPTAARKAREGTERGILHWEEHPQTARHAQSAGAPRTDAGPVGATCSSPQPRAPRKGAAGSGRRPTVGLGLGAAPPPTCPLVSRTTDLPGPAGSTPTVRPGGGDPETHHVPFRARLAVHPCHALRGRGSERGLSARELTLGRNPLGAAGAPAHNATQPLGKGRGFTPN